MLEWVIRASWVVVALIHAAPAAAFFAPRQLERLYGVSPDGDVGVLLAHRGALLLAVFALCIYGALSPDARRAA